MEPLGWLRDLSNADKHRVATFSFTGLAVEPAPEVGIRKFSALHLLFGTDEGHLGFMGIQAIFVTVEAALQEIESGRRGQSALTTDSGLRARLRWR